jgi:hypothetical protein
MIKGYIEYANKASYSYIYNLNDENSIKKAQKDLEDQCYDHSDDFDQNSEGVGSSAYDKDDNEIEDYDEFFEDSDGIESEFDADETEYVWIYADGSETESSSREKAQEVFADLIKKKKIKKPVQFRVSQYGREYDKSYGKFKIL